MYFEIVINREKKKQEENSPKNQEKGMFQSVHILGEEKMAKERKKKLRELLIQTFKEDHQVGIVMSPYSAFCSINDRGLHDRWDCVTLSPANLIPDTTVAHAVRSVPSAQLAWCTGWCSSTLFRGLFLYTLCDPGQSGYKFGMSS